MISALVVCCIFGSFAFVTGVTIHHYYWREYFGVVPHDGISFAGIYVAQIPVNGILPASLYPSTNEAVSEVAGHKVTEKHGIKVLCDPNPQNFYWEYTTTEHLSGSMLDSLVVGGREVGTTLYIGKVFNEGVWKIGKVFPASSPHGGFRGWVNADNTQLGVQDFEILKYKSHPIAPRC